ncbi:MAG: glycosyltransferase family 4 protein [Planctomycetes bacterium]|nr:glycosyltransferase family 4 protein [Planctomycetota bacterium]
MRIAITHAQDGPDADGYAADLLRVVLDAGHDVHLFTPASPWSRGLDPRARVRRVPDPWKGIDFMRAWSYDRWVTRHARRAEWDVVHGLSWSSAQDVLSVGAEAPPPPAGKREGLLLRQRRAIEARRHAAGAATRVLAPSSAAAEGLRRRFGLGDEVVVSRPGADTERFTPALRAQWGAAYRERIAVDPGAFVVLCLTNAYRESDVPGLIEVCRRLKERGLPGGRAVRFGVVGREKKQVEAEMSARCKAEGIYDHLKFYGPQHLLERWISLADVVLLPARAEAPFSRAAWEAMAGGVPVIASRAVGAAEVLEHGRDGFVLDDPFDPAQAVDLLLRLAGDEEARARVGAAARETAERWSFARHAREVLAVYEQVAAGKATAVAR